MDRNAISATGARLDYPYTSYDRVRIKENRNRMIVGNQAQVKAQIMKLSEDYHTTEFMTILYSGTMALNGNLSMGFKGDWATHNLEHAVSAIHDIPHGCGLETNVERSKRLAIEVFGVDPSNNSDKEVAEADIQALRELWISIGAPSWLADYDIDALRLNLWRTKR